MLPLAVMTLCMAGSATAIAQTPADSTRTDTALRDSTAHRLNEAEVTAEQIKTYTDRMEVFLTEENRRFGNNALDAISSLPMFRNEINGTSINTIGGEKVAIFINGRRSNEYELRALKGDNILKVKYYTVPPVRYATQVSGPMIDVVVRRNRDRHYTATLNTENALNSVINTNYGTFTYADSLNFFMLSDYVDNRNYKDMKSTTTYNYGAADFNRYHTDKGRYSGFSNLVTAGYQRYQGKHQLYVGGSFNHLPGKNEYPYEVDMQAGADNTAAGRRDYLLESAARTAAGTVYYTYAFDPQRALSVNVVNTYSLSTSLNEVGLTMAPPYEGLNYQSSNYVRNKTYSLSAQADYTAPKWGGQTNVGGSFYYRNLRQKYNHTLWLGNKSLQYYVYAAYARQVKRVGFRASAGLQASTQRGDGGTETRLAPNAMLQANWFVAQGFYLSAAAQTALNSPSSGLLTTSRTVIDRNYFAMGNPALVPGHSTTLQLQPTLYTRNQRLYVQAALAYTFSHKPFIQGIHAAEGNTFVQQWIQPDKSRTLNASLAVSYTPFNWLQLAPYVWLWKADYRTLSNHYYKPYMGAGGSVTLTKGEFSLVYNVSSPRNSSAGDIRTYSGWSHIGVFNWKHKAISLGLRWEHSVQHERDYADVPGFSYSNSTAWSPFKNKLALLFVYNFSKGKPRQQPGRRLNANETDTGLTTTNTAKSK